MRLFEQSIDSIIPEVKEWRRHLHQYPEPSFEEYETTEYIIEQIEKLTNITYERLSKTGVVARLEGNTSGPVIALRADIDALRMPEKTDVSFTSKNEGIMHACGHDSHVAMLLGVLYVLSKHQSELEGAFVFIFQAAEELFPGGARELVEKGVLNGVDAIIGQHAGPKINVGHIGTRSGYLTANSDTFKLTVIGRGGHASSPQSCLDPIPVGAQIVTALQGLVRRIAAKDSAVVSVTQFHSGTADNVIPDTVVISGTVRTYSAENRNFIETKIKRIAEQYVKAFGMVLNFVYCRGYDFLYNSPEFTTALMGVADELYGPDAAVTMDPGMGGEDFSYYLQKVPGCFYFLGTRNEKLDCIYPTHSTKFCIDEDSFVVGISVMLNGAIRFQELVKNHKK